MALHNEYQYETSPKKLKPEYSPKKNKLKKSKKNNNTKSKNKTKVKRKNKIKVKLVLYILVTFVVLFAICYRNSKINEEFSSVKTVQKELAQIEKENEQLNVNIQNDLNLNQIEKSAKEMLGMQKLTIKQTENLNLAKKDYVETSSEEVIIEQQNNFFTNIINFIKNIF